MASAISDACVLLPQEEISDNAATTSENVMRKSSTTRPNSKKKAPNIGGCAANIACGFFEFGRVVLAFLITFPRLFAVLSLIPSRDNSWATLDILFC